MYIRTCIWLDWTQLLPYVWKCLPNEIFIIISVPMYVKCQSDSSGSGCSKSGDITSANQMSHLKCAPLPCIYIYAYLSGTACHMTLPDWYIVGGGDLWPHQGLEQDKPLCSTCVVAFSEETGYGSNLPVMWCWQWHYLTLIKLGTLCVTAHRLTLSVNLSKCWFATHHQSGQPTIHLINTLPPLPNSHNRRVDSLIIFTYNI